MATFGVAESILNSFRIPIEAEMMGIPPCRSQSTNLEQHDIREEPAPSVAWESHKPTNYKAGCRTIHSFAILPKITISQRDGSVESREQSPRVPDLNLYPREEQSVGMGQDFGPFRSQYRPAGESTI